MDGRVPDFYGSPPNWLLLGEKGARAQVQGRGQTQVGASRLTLAVPPFSATSPWEFGSLGIRRKERGSFDERTADTRDGEDQREAYNTKGTRRWL